MVQKGVLSAGRFCGNEEWFVQLRTEWKGMGVGRLWVGGTVNPWGRLIFFWLLRKQQEGDCQLQFHQGDALWNTLGSWFHLQVSLLIKFTSFNWEDALGI